MIIAGSPAWVGQSGGLDRYFTDRWSEPFEYRVGDFAPAVVHGERVPRLRNV